MSPNSPKLNPPLLLSKKLKFVRKWKLMKMAKFMICKRILSFISFSSSLFQTSKKFRRILYKFLGITRIFLQTFSTLGTYIMEYFCTCTSMQIFFFRINHFFFIQNTNQVLDVFTNNQLDNVKTVSSSDEAFFAKYLTSEKVCWKN